MGGRDINTEINFQTARRNSVRKSVRIRQAQPSDLKPLTELLAQSFHAPGGQAPWYYPLLKMSIQEDLRQRLRSISDEYVCLVAVTQSVPEAIVGTVEINVRPQYGYAWLGLPGLLISQVVRSPYLSNLAVAESSRRQGVGLQLLDACQQTAQQWGHREIYLHVLEDNRAAQNLYQQAGYRFQRPDPSWETWIFQQSQRLLLKQTLGQQKLMT